MMDVNGSEYADAPVAVCLEHGSFIPCRKGSSEWECRYSSAQDDVAMVRYHQEVSVRLQRPKPSPPPPVIVEVTTPAEDWTFSCENYYGSMSLMCDGMVYSEFPWMGKGRPYLVGCRTAFSSDSAGDLLEEIRGHLARTTHYLQQPGG